MLFSIYKPVSDGLPIIQVCSFRCMSVFLFPDTLPYAANTGKFWTHKIPTRKNIGPMKYPQENILNPRKTHKKKC